VCGVRCGSGAEVILGCMGVGSSRSAEPPERNCLRTAAIGCRHRSGGDRFFAQEKELPEDDGKP